MMIPTLQKVFLSRNLAKRVFLFGANCEQEYPYGAALDDIKWGYYQRSVGRQDRRALRCITYQKRNYWDKM